MQVIEKAKTVPPIKRGEILALVVRTVSYLLMLRSDASGNIHFVIP
jgi:hypothetical protein